MKFVDEIINDEKNINEQIFKKYYFIIVDYF